MNEEKDIQIFRNRDVEELMIGVPEGHMHLRLILKIRGRYYVLQEATVAAIVRGYINIKTHPSKKAVKMMGRKLQDRKAGYAEHQLVEVDADDEEIINEISRIIVQT